MSFIRCTVRNCSMGPSTLPASSWRLILRKRDIGGQALFEASLFCVRTIARSRDFRSRYNDISMPSARSGSTSSCTTISPRRPALQNWLMYPYKLLRPIGYVSPALWRGIRDIARRLNYVYESRSAIEAGFRQRLAIEYASDVRNLEMLLGVNLDHWLACPSPVVSNPLFFLC